MPTARYVAGVLAPIAAIICLSPSVVQADDKAQNIASPDKKWTYRCENGVLSSLIDTATGTMAINLSSAVDAPYCTDAEIIWSPDCRRFAFNYSPPHAPHTTYDTVTLFELREGKWTQMPELIAKDDSHQAQLVSLGKTKLPKEVRVRHAEAHHDVLKLKKWTDDKTAVLFSRALWTGAKSGDVHVAYLFTIRFDNDGKARIIKAEPATAENLPE